MEEGFDLCQQLQNVEVGQGSRPRQPITIASSGKLGRCRCIRPIRKTEAGHNAPLRMKDVVWVTNERQEEWHVATSAPIDCPWQQLELTGIDTNSDM